jgi:glyoxylase-like metal-dependent hydrolase (beta-lactamase superfamily II)
LLTFTAAAPPFMKNAWLAACPRTRRAVAIDPGDEVDDLIAAAARERLTVEQILLTHAHLDHITGVRRAVEAFRAPVWLHAADLPLYDAIVEQGLMFGLRCERQPPVDHLYEPAGQLTVGDLAIRVHHTPGHAPGGVCLEIAGELFVGDTLFAGSIGRTDLPGGDHATLLASIHRVLLAFPDETIVHPGHGPDTTIGRERATNPYLTSGGLLP